MTSKKTVKSSIKSEQNLPTRTNKTIAKKEIDKMLSPLTESWKVDLFQSWLSQPTVSIGAICDNFGYDKTAVSVALKVDKTFNQIYNKVRKICDKIELMNLESVSEQNAMEPKNMVERLFRLKSLDRDRYADKKHANGANIDININFGNGVSTYKNNKSVKDAEIVTPTAKPMPSADIQKAVESI